MTIMVKEAEMSKKQYGGRAGGNGSEYGSACGPRARGKSNGKVRPMPDRAQQGAICHGCDKMKYGCICRGR